MLFLLHLPSPFSSLLCFVGSFEELCPWASADVTLISRNFADSHTQSMFVEFLQGPGDSVFKNDKVPVYM